MTDVGAVRTLADRVVASVGTVILGKSEEIRLVLASLLAGGHVLLEDVPGTGKTMLARSLSSALGLDFGRIQCTPDLLPNDITGVNVFDPRSAEFSFRPGPVFANVVLADEVNRATPRTQSALLEAMAERQVTVDGETRPLPAPFVVMATQNPVEFEGTFPLPEAQLDRFLLSTRLGYPGPAEEATLVAGGAMGPSAESVATVDEVAGAMDVVAGVHVDDDLARYVVSIVDATRSHGAVTLGASTRASIALGSVARARAAMEGRDFVIPDDVKELAGPVLAHRLVLDADARLRRIEPRSLVDSIVASTPTD